MPELIRPSYSPRKDQLFAQLLAQGQTMPQGMEPQPGQISQLAQLMAAQPQPFLDRYVQEFAGRHNVRSQDTIDQMQSLRSGMEGKRLTYKTLIADNGLASGARA